MSFDIRSLEVADTMSCLSVYARQIFFMLNAKNTEHPGRRTKAFDFDIWPIYCLVETVLVLDNV